MLYDNTYYLGQIFQTFLYDTPELLDYVHSALSQGDETPSDVRTIFSDGLRTWLEQRHLVIDAAASATLFQMASDFAALTETCEDSQASMLPDDTYATACL